MSTKDKSGPAFPMATGWVKEVTQLGREVAQVRERNLGMTLRDYFMAHAPAEPQSWFFPVMVDCPAVPSILSVTDEALRHQLRAMEDGSEDESPEAVAWFENRNRMIEAQEEWQAEFRKQNYIQWPAAWADSMLEQR